MPPTLHTCHHEELRAKAEITLKTKQLQRTIIRQTTIFIKEVFSNKKCGQFISLTFKPQLFTSAHRQHVYILQMDFLQGTQGHHKGESPETKSNNVTRGHLLPTPNNLGNEAWKFANGMRVGQLGRLGQNQMLSQCGKCVSMCIVHNYKPAQRYPLICV